MRATEKSDLPEVARKRANKTATAVAEPVERRGGAKENAELQNTVLTQSREAVSCAQARIREAVTRNRQDKLTACNAPHGQPNNRQPEQKIVSLHEVSREHTVARRKFIVSMIASAREGS